MKELGRGNSICKGPMAKGAWRVRTCGRPVSCSRKKQEGAEGHKAWRWGTGVGGEAEFVRAPGSGCSLESAGERWKQLGQRARPAFKPDLLTHGRSHWPELRRQFPRDWAWAGHCQGRGKVSQARWSWSRKEKLGVPWLGGHQL